ncbi:hypothetical protein LTR37_017024 [Vermiconidia calcicola]|uniref:Uncharacterized protein n=1 Tax=Vermiconidia calcicola TaxID=1690605 RepID=A0ACC3ML71_9PEZI|nr:hypothetical protein LTR37_017024 [Vermiconidia calcicola]
MVSDEQLRSWRLLAQKYRIWQKPQNEEWPLAHQANFQCIRNLSQKTFDAYKNSTTVNPASEPWKPQTLARAEWLVARATRLSNSSESSWRMHLENDILERFAVEVAWYEVGTSRLFEERMDEFIDDLDPLPEQPKQKPDRIIGLRETKNIHRLLEQPARFMRGDTAAKNIHYLQSGDITTNDGAIQLLLLVDYIMDWARDIFRTSIITQLTSFATGVDFDQVSLGPDSDIVSKKASVFDWMSRMDIDCRPGDALHASGVDYMAPMDHDDTPSVTLPVCELGAVRSASTNIFKLAGLRVTEGNVESLLTLSNNPADKRKDPLDRSGKFRDFARKLVNEITRWKEVLLVLGADLDLVEKDWTDQREEHEPFDEGNGAEFYALFEYRCFINIKWQIIRQLSYLAISKKAYTMLLEYAAFIKRQPRIDQFAQAPRSCSGSLIKEAIDCLRSGSAWQVLHSAISSTLLTLYPLPARVREYDTPPVVSLELGYRNAVRIRHFIEDFMSLAERSIPEWSHVAKKLEPSSKRHKGQNDAWEAKTSNRSFRKVSQREVQVLDDPHIPLYCPRCRASRQKMFPPQSSGQKNSPLYTSYKAILVSSLREEGEDEYEGKCYLHRYRCQVSSAARYIPYDLASTDGKKP